MRDQTVQAMGVCSSGSQPRQVTLQLVLDGTTKTIEMSNDDTLLELIAKAQIAFDVHSWVKKTQMALRGTTLDDGDPFRSLKSYGINENDTLHIMLGEINHKDSQCRNRSAEIDSTKRLLKLPLEQRPPYRLGKCLTCKGQQCLEVSPYAMITGGNKYCEGCGRILMWSMDR